MSDFFYDSSASASHAFLRIYNADAKQGGEADAISKLSVVMAVDFLEALNAGTVVVDGVHSVDKLIRVKARRALKLISAFRNSVVPESDKKKEEPVESVEKPKFDVYFPMGRPHGFTDEDVERVAKVAYSIGILKPWEDDTDLSVVRKAMEREMKKCCCTGMASYIGLNRKENGEKPDAHVCKNIGLSEDDTPVYHGIGAAAMNEASSIINGARNEQYGKPEDCFAAIAGAWSALIGHSFTPRDVARMMIVLKCVRDSHQSKHDNMVDAIGYAAIASEMD